MSDVMLFGVLRMPYEMAMGDDLSRRQFYDRAQEAADRLQAMTTPARGELICRRCGLRETARERLGLPEPDPLF